jgi:hypothetical protein
MRDDSTGSDRIQKPFYHMTSDVFRWHQFQGNSSNDCGSYSVAIVVNAILNEWRLQGDAVAHEMEKLKWVSRPVPHPVLFKFRNWASLPWGIAGYLREQGIPARWRWLGQIEDLLRNLREERFTIVLIGDLLAHTRREYTPWGHAKVLYGYEPPGGADVANVPPLRPGFYFVDPGFVKGVSDLPAPLEGVFWQDEHEFRTEWGNLLRICIEAGPRVAS